MPDRAYHFWRAGCRYHHDVRPRIEPRPGKSADFVYLRSPAPSPLAAVLDREFIPEQMLAALITLEGAKACAICAWQGRRFMPGYVRVEM